ncbi:GPCR, rhodopsin-like, 7TM domain-containing protein [Strongyloides ratti]|uniref:GPCR, rhodopsin-like, 7TM domain-containing protein n=1 Tax=Strongyloides ratti TaxID=34506 RepID=A0A090N0F4_STRRB|nr:GPCR, rhodopsin-like, 7TM domain-containing protein [Strongyloides ratti]CEF70592.1 GPCR, rhodopsin-like, 7TM domain-containing protein [Strongyloides ratti]
MQIILNITEKILHKEICRTFNHETSKCLWSGLLVLLIQPLLCIIGILLNLICMIVFFSMKTDGYYRKTSYLIMIASLSFFNCIQLFLSIFVIILPAGETYIVKKEHMKTLEKLRIFNSYTLPLGYPFVMMANYCSVWIMTLMCAQRYQNLLPAGHVLKSKLIFLKNSKKVIIIACLFAFVLNIVRFFEFTWDGNNLIKSKVYGFWYILIMEVIIYGIFVYIIPLLFLLWFNFNNLRLVAFKNCPQKNTSVEYRTIMMTFVIFVFFILLTTMSVTLRLTMILFGSWLGSQAFETLMDINNLLINGNAFVIPIVVIIFTRGFRDLFFMIKRAPSPDDPYIPITMKLNKRKDNTEEKKQFCYYLSDWLYKRQILHTEPDYFDDGRKKDICENFQVSKNQIQCLLSENTSLIRDANSNVN